MSSYTKATNFASKDTLPTGDANKIVKGTEIDNEFNAISGAISSKADTASPTFTGTPTAPTASAGNNTTQVATTAHVFAERTNVATLTNKTLTSPTINAPTISGGSISGITDLAVADGGTGSSSLSANAVLLGNGTSALQTVAPGTDGNFLRSDGTTWVSASAALGTGTVTSVATGNGLQGGTITTSGTLSVACPTFNTVGSYAFCKQYIEGNPSVSYAGSNYAAGSGNLQLSLASYLLPSTIGSVSENGSISGTWKLMAQGTDASGGGNGYVLVVACRVS